MSNEKIIGVAIKLADGKICALKEPARHHNVINLIRGKDSQRTDTLKGHTQGFLTSLGRFVDRVEALKIAKENDQIVKRCGGDVHQLYSENLW